MNILLRRVICRDETNYHKNGHLEWVLRRVFGPKMVEETGEWKRLHNEELNDMYCSSNIIRVMKSRRMRWAWHVARMERGKACKGFWWGT